MSTNAILFVNGKSYDEVVFYDRIISVQVVDLTLTETWQAMHVAPTGEDSHPARDTDFKAKLQ